MDTESSQLYLLLGMALSSLCVHGFAITKEAETGKQWPGPCEETPRPEHSRACLRPSLRPRYMSAFPSA